MKTVLSFFSIYLHQNQNMSALSKDVRWFIPVALIVILLLGIQPLRAELLEKDYLSNGDGLLTLDTTTDLEWLDITATVSRSFNDVSTQLSIDAEFPGFRQATVADVEALLAAASLVLNETGYLGKLVETSALLDLIGRTSTSVDMDALYGFIKPPFDTYPPSMFHTMVRPDGYTETAAYISPSLPDGNWVDPGHGNFLVRKASTAPGVNGFWPSVGSAGDLIFVFGKNFMTAGPQIMVCIESLCTYAVQVASNDMLIFIVPPGIGSGTIQVRTNGGLAASAVGFPSQTEGLTISGIWPGEVATGNIVFVFGAGFDPVLGATQVTVSGLPTFLSQVLSTDMLVVVVPPGATTGLIEVTVNGVIAASPINLIVN